MCPCLLSDAINHVVYVRRDKSRCYNVRRDKSRPYKCQFSDFNFLLIPYATPIPARSNNPDPNGASWFVVMP